MSTVAEKRQQLLNMLPDALRGLRMEIEKGERGEASLDALPQLRFIESRLLEMRELLQREDWASLPRRAPDVGRIVIDHWSPGDPLGERVLEIEYIYGRLK